MELPFQCGPIDWPLGGRELNFGIEVSGDCGKGYFCCGDPPFGANPQCVKCYSTWFGGHCDISHYKACDHYNMVESDSC